LRKPIGVQAGTQRSIEALPCGDCSRCIAVVGEASWDGSSSALLNSGCRSDSGRCVHEHVIAPRANPGHPADVQGGAAAVLDRR
jgi:hypothetical protein